MIVTKRSNRAGQEGYNLVEVLIALALTGVVILSILTLFFLGRRNVYSGKQMSAANAVATRVLEDLAMMSATDVAANFGITDSTNLTTTNTVAGVSYPNSVIRSTNGTINSTTDPANYLARWQALVPSTTFNNAHVVLIIIPASPRDNAKPVTTAQVVRVRGVIEWNESLRRRSITFDASKLQRP